MRTATELSSSYWRRKVTEEKGRRRDERNGKESNGNAVERKST